MHEWQSLSHVRWDCKYHVVIIPKYRKRKLYGELRKHVGEVIRELCRQRALDSGTLFNNSITYSDLKSYEVSKERPA